MTDQQPDIARLEGLLHSAFDALRAGNLTELAALSEATETEIGILERITDPALAAHIQQLAERNTLCLAAAARGLRSARRRLTEISAARAGLQSYDGSGRRQQISGPSGTMKHRF